MLLLFLCIGLVLTVERKSYYLIDLDRHASLNTSNCSSLVHRDQSYRIPRLCHSHLLCSPSSCDDPSFRCVKLRETLCCAQRHLRRSCPDDDLRRLKDQFRSLYFDVSIEHGYCEINLERIEQDDRSYCIAMIKEDSTSAPRLAWRSAHRLAARPNRSTLAQLDDFRRDSIIFGQQSMASSFSYHSEDYLTVFSIVVGRVYLQRDKNV